MDPLASLPTAIPALHLFPCECSVVAKFEDQAPSLHMAWKTFRIYQSMKNVPRSALTIAFLHLQTIPICIFLQCLDFTFKILPMVSIVALQFSFLQRIFVYYISTLLDIENIFWMQVSTYVNHIFSRFDYPFFRTDTCVNLTIRCRGQCFLISVTDSLHIPVYTILNTVIHCFWYPG